MVSGVNAGTDRGVNAATVPTAPSWTNYNGVTYGSNNDQWGNALTPALVNASDFGLTITAGPTLGCPAQTLSVDYAKLVVYYGNYARYITLQFDRADGTVTNATTTSFTDTTNLTQVDDTWDGAVVDIVSGTGAGQNNSISSFNGGSSKCTMVQAWNTTPDTTSRYQITWQSRKIRYRIVLVTGSATNTPIVKAFTQRFQPRPPSKRGWKFSVKAADNMENNLGAIREQCGAEELKDLSFYWRNVKAPMLFKNKDGEEIFVEVTECTASEVYYNPQDSESEGNREYQLALTVVEA